MIQEKKSLNVSTKSFITATIVIFSLMILTYLLTFIIPSGEYARIIDANGNLIIDTTQGFAYTDGNISFLKWLFSPFLVLVSDGNIAVISVLIFLLVIGGIFNCLDSCGLMKYMLDVITVKFHKKKYLLLSLITLFFMALGSLVGSFEECVPLVPIVVALAIRLGWDSITGLGMSILAASCGFAAGICNPFTVGVAQQLAGLPMFSGMGYRSIAFVCIYILLIVFLYLHTKKINTTSEMLTIDFTYKKHMNKALICFISILSIGIVCILSSAFLPFLQDYTMIIVAIMFLLAGIFSTLLAKMTRKELVSEYIKGVINMLPAVFMILMANSIKYTLVESKILDTLLYHALQIANTLPNWSIILFIYLIVLVLNFFIPSGSAKAFLLIPIMVPMAQLFGISSQLCIMAFAFGDGFSNIFYPTNPVLLISLGLADTDYLSWVKWSWKFQFMNIVLTSAILLIGLFIAY